MPDNIPQELLENAECVIVIPSMTKVAMGVGGSYGRGAMVCRTGKTYSGPWGSPAMYSLEGGSFGLQLGGESTDVVLLVMNNRGVDALLSSKVKLGGDASAAAGPKGRSSKPRRTRSMRAEILSYSRSRGLFAGVSLEGTSLRPDDDANAQVYGRKLTARSIVTISPYLESVTCRPSKFHYLRNCVRAPNLECVTEPHRRSPLFARRVATATRRLPHALVVNQTRNDSRGRFQSRNVCCIRR